MEMSNFVQLGDDFAFNPYHVDTVTFTHESVAITFVGLQMPITLEGDKAHLFKAWWEEQANVYRTA